jgi:hypothetical protein
MQDYYTTEQLSDRGCASLMIKAHLGKADEAGAARSDLEKRSEATALAKRALQLTNSKHAT